MTEGKNGGEIGFLLAAGTMVLFGLALIYSASGVLAGQHWGDSAYFLKRQLLWALIAVPTTMAAASIDYHRWRSGLAYFSALLFVLLILVLVPGLGRMVNGSRRWLGLWGVSIQPSEIAKLFVVLYVANYLSKKGERLARWGEGMFPPLIVSGVTALLILAEPDFGTTAGLLLVVASLLFIGGAPIRNLIGLALVGLPLVGVWALGSAYRRERLLTFLNPWNDASRHGYQIIQSYLALGGGGALGMGWGQGRQKLFYLPEPHTDFIFAVAGEELGLLGTLVLVAFYLFLLQKGLRLAMRTDDPFGHLLAAGLTLMIVVPALLNMGVVTGLLPTKGLPLPLVSYGGSSLLVNLFAVGLLYNISKRPRSGGLCPDRIQDLRTGGGQVKRRWGG